MDPEWLKKLLAAATAPQGSNPYRTPPFVASGQAPLHSAVPEPGTGPYAQQTVPAAAVPTMQPANQVPTSPPGTATANVPAATRARVVDDTPIVNAMPRTRREQLEDELRSTAENPAKKQNKFLQALSLGLQATQRIADPENRAGAYQSGQPIQWLGEMKKADRVRKIEGELAPIYQQQKRRYEGVLAGIKGEKEIADLEKTRAETDRIRRDPSKTITKDVEGRTYYSENGGKTWSDSKGIPAPARVKVKLDSGAEIEVPGKDVYTQEQQNKRNKISADAVRASKEIDRDIAQGKYTAEAGNEYKSKVQEWEAGYKKLIVDGEEKQNLASVKEAQAADLEAKGGAAEGAALRKEAAELRGQGRSLIRQGNEMKATPPPKPDTYAVPKSRGRIDKSRDPGGYFQ